MANFIMKLVDQRDNKEYYLEWSTIVDAPITEGMLKDDFVEYYKNRYGTKSLSELDERLKRVDEYGTSLHSQDKAEDYFDYNRAGENETTLDKEGLLDNYCRETFPPNTQ